VGGIGGLGLLVVAVASIVLGVDPRELLQSVPTSSLPPSADVSPPPGSPPPGDEEAELVSVVLADTEDV
jgi:predicted metalloprotease